MASISSLYQIPCKKLQPSYQNSQFSSNNLIFPVNLINFTAKSSLTKSSSSQHLNKARTGFALWAVNGNQQGSEEEESAPSYGVAVAVAQPPKEQTEIEIFKKKLVESFEGTNRGLSACSETRAEIVELITQLEALNPTPAPTEALTLLNGKWILAYTSFPGLFPLLARSTGLFVTIEEISQTIDSDNFTVENSVLFSGPLASTSITTNAKFEVRSPKRVQIKFEGGIIGTPQLTDSIEVPENVEFLGQKIDLAPFKGVISSVQDTASSVAKTISSRPPLKFSISNKIAESWLLTTYLDEELRISRGDGGSVFVLIKEGRSLLSP